MSEQRVNNVPRRILSEAMWALERENKFGLAKELRALLTAPASVESLVGRTGGGMVWRECTVCHVKGSYHPDVPWCICGRPFEAPADQHQAAQLESLAKTVYDSWQTQPGWVPWVDGGNSLKQDEARRIARRTFELALANLGD